MTEKERILIDIIKQLKTAQALSHGFYGYKRDTFKGTREGEYYTHWGLGTEERDIKIGDLVMCETMHTSDYSIGFVHTILTSSNMVIREIGTNRLCNVSNEMFVPLRDIHESILLDGDRRAFRNKVQKVIRKADHTWHLYGGIKFLEDNIAEVTIRTRYGGLDCEVPYKVKINWNKRTSQKFILEELNKAGFGTREFDKDPECVKEKEAKKKAGKKETNIIIEMK